MAVFCRVVFVLVFSKLVWHTEGVCKVTCTTDYISSMNCSCLGSTEPVINDIQAECRDEFESVVGSCVIRPPDQWCEMNPEHFYSMAEIDTVCTLHVKHFNTQNEMLENTTHTVQLNDIIKPREPFNLTLTKSDQAFNLSWKMVYTEDENVDLNGDLIYRVRLRPKDDWDKKHIKLYNVRIDERHQEIQCEPLFAAKTYIVDVQASVNPEGFSKSGDKWSEWSLSTEFTCPHRADSYDIFWPKSYILLPILVFGLLVFFGMLGLRRKQCLFQYIPNPQDFFKPLYHTYQGDFKKWVGPVFTFNSMDVLEKSAPLQVLIEKQQVSVPLQLDLLSNPESARNGHGDWSVLSLVNPDFSKRYFLGGSSLGLSHFSGHISMDTVTVSDQEGFVSDFSESNHNPRLAHNAHHPGSGSGENSERRVFHDRLPQLNNMEDAEEISLDSFSSNEHSDDGYPQVGLDLDTIDSGFLESDCSSPVSLECDGGESTDDTFLNDAVVTHSNYVKQWVAVKPASEEGSNVLQ